MLSGSMEKQTKYEKWNTKEKRIVFFYYTKESHFESLGFPLLLSFTFVTPFSFAILANTSHPSWGPSTELNFDQAAHDRVDP
jgi:hypothetical protein